MNITNALTKPGRSYLIIGLNEKLDRRRKHRNKEKGPGYNEGQEL